MHCRKVQGYQKLIYSLLSEFRNTYGEVLRTVGRYRETSRSDTNCCVYSQGREVGTAMTECWRLNVTGKA